MIVDILVNGLVRSGEYAMLALGFGLVFGVGRILNLAHTAFYMLAAYGIFALVGVGLGMPLAALIVSIGVPGVALLLYRLFVEPVHELETTVLLSTLAIAVLIQEVCKAHFKADVLHVPSVFPGYTILAGVRVKNQQIATLALALGALSIVGFLLFRTRLGLAIRAAAQDRTVANVVGIDVRRVTAVVIVLGALLAALAGIAVAPGSSLTPEMWTHHLVTVLVAVVLGGLGSVRGSLLGAVILAFVEVAVVSLFPGRSYLQTVVALLLMVAVFLVRPEGLFGARIPEER